MSIEPLEVSQKMQVLYAALGTVLAALLIAIGSIGWSIRDSVRQLEQYHESEWPLERQLLMIEVSQLKFQIDANIANIEELENEIRRLQ